MQFLSPEYFVALAIIIGIDLVLAGDNAIVIGIAARNVPKEMQKKVIFWGTAGAIVIRVIFTLGIVWLLKIPGLMLVGGLLLIPVAYKLMFSGGEDDHNIASSASVGGAIKTIIVADALMGVDNVLGVAGAAKGDFSLVVLGLLISIPIMVWGSTLVLKWIERFPRIVTIGCGILLWTAFAMIAGEALLKPYLPANVWAVRGIVAACTIATLGLFLLRERQLAGDKAVTNQS
jgi:YjbE family integral membrane protein